MRLKFWQRDTSDPKKQLKHKWLRRIGLGAAILIGCLVVLYIIIVRPNPFYNANKVPKLVTANFIDLDKIFIISKFRSGAGHDYSADADGETCRSMKHYFNFGHAVDAQNKPVHSIATVNEPNINIYAPFNGFISSNSKQSPGNSVVVVSQHNPLYDVRLFHIYPVPGLHFGSHVRAGQLVGTIGPRDGMDVALESSSWGPGGHNMSVFQAMTNEAFKPYADMGFQRSDFTITQQERDGHPLECADEGQFKFNPSQRDSPIEDYIYLHPDPYADKNQGPNPRPIHYGPPAR